MVSEEDGCTVGLTAVHAPFLSSVICIPHSKDVSLSLATRNCPGPALYKHRICMLERELQVLVRRLMTRIQSVRVQRETNKRRHSQLVCFQNDTDQHQKGPCKVEQNFLLVLFMESMALAQH